MSKNKFLCPDCGGALRFIRNFHVIEVDVPVIHTRYVCVKCKSSWIYDRFIKTWSCEWRDRSERGLNAEDGQTKN